jgi:hypothetical protein
MKGSTPPQCDVVEEGTGTLPCDPEQYGLFHYYDNAFNHYGVDNDGHLAVATNKLKWETIVKEIDEGDPIMFGVKWPGVWPLSGHVMVISGYDCKFGERWVTIQNPRESTPNELRVRLDQLHIRNEPGAGGKWRMLDFWLVN